MADSKYSALPAAATLTGAEIFAIAQAGNSVRTTVSALQNNALGTYTPLGTGAVPTTVAAKLAQEVSVLDFGADPTGVADSTAAFNAAGLAAAQVIIPAGGTYTISGRVTGLFLNLGATINGVRQFGIAANTIATTLQGFDTQLGSQWQSQFHANWNVVQTQVPYNPTEWQVYSNAAQGIATVTIGTNQVTRVSGTAFDPAWVGLNYFYWNGSGYKVLAVADSSHLTVQTTSGGAVSWGATATNTFYFVTTSTTSVVNVNGTAVTYVSGQPFYNLPGQFVYINGTAYTVSAFNSATSLTLSSSAGTLINATLKQYANIANELSTLRLQGLAGADEENFVASFTPWGAVIQTTYAGNGKYRPIVIQDGEDGVGVGQVLLGVYPGLTLGTPGHVTIGGGPGPVTQSLNNQAVQVESNPLNVNYLDLNGAATGGAPAIRAQGTDASVSLGLDMHGASTLTISTDFALTHGQWFAVASATSWPTLASSTSGAPILGANGAAANIDISLAPKGTGSVWVGPYTAGVQTSTGYMTVKDSTGTLRRLLCL